MIANLTALIKFLQITLFQAACCKLSKFFCSQPNSAWSLCKLNTAEIFTRNSLIIYHMKPKIQIHEYFIKFFTSITISYRFPWIFLSKFQIQSNLLNFPCQKYIFKQIYLNFHIKTIWHKISVNSHCHLINYFLYACIF